MISLLLGGFVGILLAITGAGGSIVSVPLLIMVLHIPIAEASPIGLLAVMMAAGTGAVLGLRSGIVRYKAAGIMACCGLLFAPFGIWLAQRSPNDWLIVAFAVVLVFVALRMLRHANRELDALGWVDNRLSPPCEVDNKHGRIKWNAPCARTIMVSGSIAGFLSGLLGVGGGFVLVPALRDHTNLDIKSIVATTLATIALVSAGSVFIAAQHGLMDWGHGLPFSAGAILGMLCGRMVANRLAGPRIQQAFAIFALLIAAGLCFKLDF